MQSPPIPENESARLQVLMQCNLLDTEPEDVFDRITRIASQIAQTPISLISLVDTDRQWFKSRQGLDATETPRDISFCGHAILGSEPFIVDDASQDPRFADNPLVTDQPAIRFYLGIPLEIGSDMRIGTLCVIDDKPRKLDQHQIEALTDLADLANREIRYREAIGTDPLTGLYNRRMLYKLAEMEVALAERTGIPFSMALLDLDHFKQVNDRYGHDGGDAVLVEVARTCREFVRRQDAVFRLGGEELAILLANTDAANATVIMERLRSRIEQLHISSSARQIRVTTSIGVAQFCATNSDIDATIKRADQALYRAKAGGRNQVALAGPA